MAKKVLCGPSNSAYMMSDARKEYSKSKTLQESTINDKWQIVPINLVTGSPFSECYYFYPNKSSQENEKNATLQLTSMAWIINEGTEADKKITQGFVDLLNEKHITIDPFYLLGKDDVELCFWSTRGNCHWHSASLSRGVSNFEPRSFLDLHSRIFEQNKGILSANDAKVFFNAEKVAKYLGLIA